MKRPAAATEWWSRMDDIDVSVLQCCCFVGGCLALWQKNHHGGEKKEKERRFSCMTDKTGERRA